MIVAAETTPLWQRLCSTAPPSVLPDISPTRGEIGCHLAFANLPTLQRSAQAPMTADLPPCGGDVRQDRGGREGSQASPQNTPPLPHSALFPRLPPAIFPPPSTRAPASPAYRGAGRSSRRRRSPRHPSASRTDIASINGGSPTAFERRSSARRSPPSRPAHVKDRRPVGSERDLVGRRRVGAQSPLSSHHNSSVVSQPMPWMKPPSTWPRSTARFSDLPTS